MGMVTEDLKCAESPVVRGCVGVGVGLFVGFMGVLQQTMDAGVGVRACGYLVGLRGAPLQAWHRVSNYILLNVVFHSEQKAHEGV